MLPVKLTLRHIGPYVDETIDFSAVAGDVIAVVGENGAGKTMLVDSVFAALYRYFPSRDSIYKYCQGKAQIIFWFKVADRNYQTTLNIDAKKREMEPWLFLDDQPLTDGKNNTFDKAIAELVGPPEIALASVFAAQNKAGSFAQLPKAKRKELFIDMLGLSKLQVVSDAAGLKEKQSKEDYDKVAARVTVLQKVQETKPDLEGLNKQLASARTEVAQAEARVKSQTEEIGTLRAGGQAMKDFEARQFPVRKRKQALLKETLEVTKALADSESLAAQVGYFRSLANQHSDLSKRLEDYRAEAGSLMNHISGYHKQMAAYVQSIRELEAQANTHSQTVLLSTKELGRAKSDAAIIDTVPCHAEGECAECQFLVQANAAKNIIGDIEERIDNATAAGLAIDQQIKALPKPDPAQLSELGAQLANANAQIKILEPLYAEAGNAKGKLATAEAAATIVNDLKLRVSRLSEEMAQADQELVELEEKLQEARKCEADYARKAKELEVEVEALDGSRLHMNTLLANIGRAELEEEQALKAEEEEKELLPVLNKLDQDRKSWNLLVKAFGKTGIQSLEIDAAGPTISEIVNDLLFSCFGPRFSIRFVTQVLKDDKTGYKDDFDIYVTDADSGREGSIDDLSGGEKVIICEGLSLALALFNRQRADIGWVSLFRDEASSAVDDRRAPLYIKMLRRAREQGHFERLFFIAHQKRVTEGADSKILVDNGKLSFE